MKHKPKGLLGKLLPLALTLMAVALILVNSRAIIDYAKLYNYTPPIEIAELADQTMMTDKARKLFYVNHPQVADRGSFNGACNNRGERTIVLGCYHSVDRGIFLFEVSDPRLNGVKQVTAAHEMLHAAYDRLSSGDRERMDALLREFYNQKVQDKRIQDTIAAYEQSEPDDITNEMHSIFATEISDLTPELETYYADFFQDRKKVVGYAANYQQEFSRRQDQVRIYDLQLLKLKDTIDTNTARLSDNEAEITSLQRQMEADRSSGNVEEYNARVPVFNNRVDRYNALIRSTQGSIAEYNRLVAERNVLALEIRGLSQSINSSFTPIDR